jgi:hypothetical protein
VEVKLLNPSSHSQPTICHQDASTTFPHQHVLVVYPGQYGMC